MSFLSSTKSSQVTNITLLTWDELGHQVLDGLRVYTAVDGAKNFAPRPAVHGMKSWEEVDGIIGGKMFKIIATLTKHFPGGECAGLIIAGEDFGYGRDGLPNDTVYIEEMNSIADQYHTHAVVMNLRNAHVSAGPDAPFMQITMSGKDGAELFRALKADVLVPMHYKYWGHFTQFDAELRQAFKEEGIPDKVRWLKGVMKVFVL